MDDAGGEVGTVAFPRAGAFAVAFGQAGLVDEGAVVACAGQDQTGRAVADPDRQRRGRHVAVAVGQPIGEDIFDAAGRSRRSNIGIGTVGRDHQAAILALHRRTRRAEVGGGCTAHAGDQRAIGAGRVCTRCAGGRTGAGDDIAALRSIAAGDRVVDVGARDRGIVLDRQGKRRGADVTVTVRDGDRDGVRGGGIGAVVGQCITVTDQARGDAGDRDLTQRGRDDLPDRSDDSPVDGNDDGLIERSDLDCAAGRFTWRSGIGSGGFSAARGERGFRHHGRRGGDADNLVGGGDQDPRFIVDAIGNHFKIENSRKAEFGWWEQVAKRKRIADVARRLGKIAARTLRATGSGFGLLSRDEGGDRRRRNVDRPDLDLRNPQRAVDDDENLPVGQGDEQIVAGKLDRVEPRAGR